MITYRKHSTFIYILVACIIIGIGGCSTKKSSIAHRSYHNLTAKFNGYFYAKESIKEGVAKLEKATVDDYSQILPIYKIGDDKSAKNIYPEMNKAYEKSSLVIERHSIFLKGKEYVKWIDDNYLVIGISHYYKRDYFAAIETFDFIAKQYRKEEIRYDAMIWMIRTYNEAGIVSKAQVVIDILSNDEKFPRHLKGEFSQALADFYLKRENYEMTINHIEKAIALERNKKVRTRLIFILAQLYHKTGEDRKSSRYFADVIKLNPPYEMAFQAKINRAKSFDVGNRKQQEIKTQLAKMLKDGKNKEYFDQIYYTLAEISQKEESTEEAIKFLKLALKTSVNNTRQKALSYLMLADIYFTAPDYKLAQAYYDSTTTFLSKDFPDYELIKNKKTSLTNLVKNLDIIAREDSLQRIAGLTELERDAFIESLINKRIEDEERKKQEEEDRKLQALNQQNNFGGQQANNNGGASGWYFTNSSTMSFGVTEFAKKWGDRKLEDHWRRSNKESFNFDEEESEDGEILGTDSLGNPIVAVVDDWKDKETYLKELPLTDEDFAKSHERIIEAYYNTGTIYKEQLLAFNHAITSFEELLNRYQKNKYLLQSYYQLYRINLLINNETRANYYKNILFNEHPNSEYTKIIKNPNYAKETQASKEQIETFYSETYNSYVSGQYLTVIDNCDIADSLYAKSYLSPKFDYVRALTIGRMQGVGPFEAALKNIVVKYPKDEVKGKAEEMLAYINNQKIVNDTALAEKPSIYKFNPDTSHNSLIIIPKSIDINDLKVALSDFNATFFSTETYTITSLFLDAEKQMAVISGIQDKNKAMTYFNAIKEDGKVLQKTGPEVKFTVISVENYPVFFNDKNLEEYLEFFLKKYQGQ